MALIFKLGKYRKNNNTVKGIQTIKKASRQSDFQSGGGTAVIVPKKEKIKARFPQTLGGKSPSERKYQECIEQFGDVGDFQSDTVVNAYGIKSFGNGLQFVIDGVTGRVIERTRDVRYLGSSAEGHYYVHTDNEGSLSRLDAPIVSFQP